MNGEILLMNVGKPERPCSIYNMRISIEGVYTIANKMLNN